MTVNYSLLTPESDPEPGKVVQSGTAEDLDRVIELSLVFPGTVPLGSLPPLGDTYWDYTPGEWVTRPERPNAASTWDYSTRAWVTSLATRRDAQWALIKAAELEADADPYTWSGHVFQADAVSRRRLQEALLDKLLTEAGGGTYSVEWTLLDNSRLTLSGADLAAVYLGIASRATAVHDKAQDKRALIYASSTPEDITWTSTP